MKQKGCRKAENKEGEKKQTSRNATNIPERGLAFDPLQRSFIILNDNNPTGRTFL
jgi:hypothetical protein